MGISRNAKASTKTSGKSLQIHHAGCQSFEIHAPDLFCNTTKFSLSAQSLAFVCVSSLSPVSSSVQNKAKALVWDDHHLACLQLELCPPKLLPVVADVPATPTPTPNGAVVFVQLQSNRTMSLSLSSAKSDERLSCCALCKCNISCQSATLSYAQHN